MYQIIVVATFTFTCFVSLQTVFKTHETLSLITYFFKISWGRMPHTPLRFRACAAQEFAPEALRRPPPPSPMKNPGYGPVRHDFTTLSSFHFPQLENK